MQRTKKWSVGLAAAAPICGLMLAAVATPADANPYLVVNGAPLFLTLNPEAGDYISVVNGNGWDLTFIIGRTFPNTGTSTSPNMDLTVQGVYNGSSPGNLQISFYGDGYTGSGNEFFESTLGQTNNLANVASTLTTCAFDPGLPPVPPNPPTTSCGGPGALTLASLSEPITFNGSAHAFGSQSLTGPYGLLMNIDLTATAGTISIDDQLTAVPEPGTIALFGAGLLGCALFLRRRSPNA